MTTENEVPEIIEGEATAGEIVMLQSQGDPELILANLEKRVALAPRFKAAIEAILVTQPYPEDWTEQEGASPEKATMCLSSAGAERVGRQFDIQFFGTKWHKEEFVDSIGKGYRYIYETNAAMGGRRTFAQGIYSTRQAFLGKKAGEYKELTEIDEENIQRDACNIMRGNAIKSLLGIRGIPKMEWLRIMAAVGLDATRAGKATRGRGNQGGTSPEDTAKQAELAHICVEIATACKTVTTSDYKAYALRDLNPDEAKAKPVEIGKTICIALSSFQGKDGLVEGKGARDLSGQRLEIALSKAREVRKQLGGAK